MVNIINLLVVLSTVVPGLMALPLEDTAARYIISFKRGLNETELDSHFDFADATHKRSLARRGLAPTSREAEGTGIIRRHDFPEFHSYAAVFDRDTLAAVASHPAVELVERDFEVGLPPLRTEDAEDVNDENRSIETEVLKDGSMLQPNAPWGLVTLSFDYSTGLPHMASVYRYYQNGQGQGIYAYVVDSGVRTTHTEFEGRAKNGVNFVNGEDITDNFGHGTHVAGIVGAKTFGVAKKVNIISVKVLGKKGTGSGADIIAAYDWILKDAKKNNRVKKSIINHSIGSPQSSEAFKKAYLEVIKAGIPVFAAAGNDNKDAKTQYPAAYKEVFTVGWITSSMKRASDSNYGDVLDIWAPGDNIQSCSHKSDKGTVKMSGTSMASPHVAGLAASFKSREGSALDPVDMVYGLLHNYAQSGKVKDVKGAPNLVLHNGLKIAARPIPDKTIPTRPPM